MVGSGGAACGAGLRMEGGGFEVEFESLRRRLDWSLWIFDRFILGIMQCLCSSSCSRCPDVGGFLVLKGKGGGGGETSAAKIL